MYSYTYDARTGGLLLNSSPTFFSKEPRPVYAPELDILGLDQYWNYDKQDEVPYMWAESGVYIYRGKTVAKVKGGELYTPPKVSLVTDKEGRTVEPEPDGGALKPIDIEAMVEANREFLDIIEGTTVKKVIHIYEKYKDSLDIFHVAFSGGKDSAVLLEIVKKALPKESFVVIFGDTGMEFPDTYRTKDWTKKMCEENEIPFYEAKSHFLPCESWHLFGPPANDLRWCCSVHKSSPQTLKLREVVGFTDYTGLDFVGVRRHESFRRSQYDYENYGKKQKKQYSFNAILEWTSAEIWLYMYANHIFINPCYKKGNARAGCLLCPMSGGISNYFRSINYPEEVGKFAKIITETNSWDAHSEEDIKTYLTANGWRNRKSGRGLAGNESHYKEETKGGKITMELIHPASDWREWMKTIGEPSFPYEVENTDQGCKIIVEEKDMKAHPKYGKNFRQVLRKGAYCIGCKVCEANCSKGKLHFRNGKVEITDCIHCMDCHDLPGGCLAFNSLKIPQGERKMKTINCFDDHAPKKEWLSDFFKGKDAFLKENILGPNQFTHFKRYLRDAGLIEKNKCTDLTDLIAALGWESNSAQGILLVNLVCENAQFEWYVKNLDIDVLYSRELVIDMLLAEEMKERAARSVANSFARLVDAPLGTVLNFGYVTEDKALARTKCTVSDSRVLLYSLYKFAEQCNDFREFTLAWLMSEDVERDGISPARIFGLEYEDMKPMLMGLSAKYPEYINAAFTNDLDKITLMEKTSQNVLALFREGL